MSILDVVFLLLVANGAPVVADCIFRQKFDFALDGRRVYADGQRILGDSKTLRGLIVAVTSAAVAALLIGHSIKIGLLVGLCSMVGDLATSFLKRRMQLPASSQAVGLDYVPEALLPTAVLAMNNDIAAGDAVVITAMFVLLATALSPILFTLGIRRQPF